MHGQNEDFLSMLRRRQGTGLNPAQQVFSAGTKRYGGTGRNNPTMGPVDPTGYKERDAQATSKRNAMLRRLKAGQRKRFMSSDYLGWNQ